jgi:SAM-dependent methyltransferase
MKYKPAEQDVRAKKAESERPYHGENIITNEALSSTHLERARTVLKDLEKLKLRNVSFDPFLEIGAGRVQRSSAFVNNYDVCGVATDISQNSLRDAPNILSLLDINKKPILICCDAHNLPFLSDSFQLVFMYRTLHHFENPIPAAKEIYRVLGKGGHFFFNEEPMDSSFRRLLRGKRMLSDPLTRAQKLGHRLGVEKVFWDDGKHERQLGMTEARFDKDLWNEALRPFEIVDIEINRRLKIHSDLRKEGIRSFLAGIIGGNVRGLCLKTEGEVVSEDINKRLMCLNCTSTKLKHMKENQLVCENCGRMYPVTEGIIRMLPQELEYKLYTEHK